MNRFWAHLRIGLVIALTAGAARVAAQIAVPVDMYMEGSASESCPPDEGMVSINGTFVPVNGPGTDGYRSESGGGSAGEWMSAWLRTVMVQPGRVYDVFVDSANLNTGRLRIDGPPGYQVVLDNKPRPVEEITSGHVAFRLVPRSQDPMLAGYASSISINRIDWRLPLGSLLNGDSAGSVGLIDPGFDTDWSPLFAPGRLYYESTSTDIWSYYEANTLRQVVAKQMALDVVVIDSSSYEIRCYNPAQQVNNWSTPRTFTGQPFVTYRIERGTPQSSDSTAVAIRLTKEVRNISASTLTAPVTRREFMTLERTGSWPTFHWVKVDWYHEGEAPVLETVVDSTSSGTIRTESIVARTPGTTTPALALTRTYQRFTDLGEMLTSEKVGSADAPLTITYCTLSEGLPGSIRSVVYPDGRWVGFTYVGNGGARRVQYEFRPYLNLPATPTFDPAQGEVKTYGYTLDAFGTITQLEGTTMKINGVRIGYESHAYEYSGVYGQANPLQQNGAMTKWLRAGFQRVWRDDYADDWRRSKPIFTIAPDGSMVGYLHEQWGNGYRETKITGKQSGVWPYTAAAAIDMQAVYLVANKSTREILTREGRGLVSRTEKQICSSDQYASGGGSWVSSEWTNYTYNYLGLLTDRVTNNGLTYHAVYDGFLKTSETDESGVTTTYTYDAASRVKTATREAVGPIAELKTRYTYDATGNVLTTTVGPDSGEQMITSNLYDDAGRITTSTPAGGYGVTTHVYDTANRTHTISVAGAGSITETHYRDGRLYSKSGTGTVAEYHTYGVETDGRTWERVDVGTASSPRWTKTWSEYPQGEARRESPGFNGAANLVAETFWNYTTNQTSTAHVYRTTQPGPGASPLVTRFDYDAVGQVFRSGLDLGDNGLVLASNDRLQETNNIVESFANAYWWRKENYIYPQSGNGTAVLAGFTRQRLTGFTGTLAAETQTQDADGNVTVVKTNVDAATATKTVTTTTTGIANAKIETYRAGLLVSITTPDGLSASTTYDALTRPSVATNSRNNATTTVYVSGTTLTQTVSQKVTATTNAVVTTHYDTAGRTDWTENTDGKRTYFAYNARNQPLRQWGAATYPVEYAYNGYGEKIAMRTFRTPTQDFTSSTWPLSDDGPDPLNPDPSAWATGDKTTWTYDPGTGLLSAKTDVAGRSVTYTYNAANQLATREWARTVPSGPNVGQRVRATYGYDATTGEQTSISYNDGTPTVSYTYTRLGQPDTVTDGATGVHDFVYDPTYPHRLSCEAFDTFYDQRVMTRLYDNTAVFGRVRGFQLGSAVNSNSDLEQSYGWASDSGRFTSVSATTTTISTTARNFHYGYEANSTLVKTLWTDDNSFFVSRTFDPYREILTASDAKWGQTAGSSLTKYEYHSNALGQRDSVVQSGDAFATYAGTDHAIHQTFTYDDRGEMKQAPTFAGSTVTDTSSPLSNRQHEFSYDDIGNRNWAGITGNVADRKVYTTNALNQIQSRDNPLAPFGGTQTFVYDADGNVTDDGQWNYTWDAENRLVTMIASTAAVYAGQPNLWIDFKYDYLGRRVEKKVTNVATNTVVVWRRYVYDGWSMVAEYSVASLSPLVLTRSYSWGIDIALSLTDAGGVGALLQIADYASGKRFLPTYDGNGNIAALINASTGSIAAVYEYGPFGETIRADVSDSSIADQPFRFSTKYLDSETGNYDYGRRYYSPSIGRFLGRDSIEEKGGLNLYGFCGNNAINRWDVLGNYEVSFYDGVNCMTYFNGEADSSWKQVSWYYVDGDGNQYADVKNYDFYSKQQQALNNNDLDNWIGGGSDISAVSGGWGGSNPGDTSMIDSWSAECANAFDAAAAAAAKRPGVYWNSVDGKFHDSKTGSLVPVQPITISPGDTIKKGDVIVGFVTEGTFALKISTNSVPGQGAGLVATIGFLPGPGAPDSNSIRMIQVVKMTDANGKDEYWRAPEQDRNTVRTSAGYFVDIFYSKAASSGASPYYADYATGSSGFKNGTSTASAAIYDAPFAPNGNGTFTAETVAVDATTNHYYGAARWGYTAAKDSATMMVPTVSNAPSQNFTDALTKFKDHYNPKNATPR